MGLRKSSKNASTSKFAKKVKNRPTLLYVCTMFSCGRVGGRGVFFNKPVHRFSTEGNFCFHSPLFNLKYLLFKKLITLVKRSFISKKIYVYFSKQSFFLENLLYIFLFLISERPLKRSCWEPGWFLLVSWPLVTKIFHSITVTSPISL